MLLTDSKYCDIIKLIQLWELTMENKDVIKKNYNEYRENMTKEPNTKIVLDAYDVEMAKKSDNIYGIDVKFVRGYSGKRAHRLALATRRDYAKVAVFHFGNLFNVDNVVFIEF